VVRTHRGALSFDVCENLFLDGNSGTIAEILCCSRCELATDYGRPSVTARCEQALHTLNIARVQKFSVT